LTEIVPGLVEVRWRSPARYLPAGRYVEYGYAKQRGFPVASVLNAAGYFTQPTAGDVAVALTKATLNADLTQNLIVVYKNPDPRTYPISSCTAT
jgi:ABC-type phosphate transport system substrate-binding protein